MNENYYLEKFKKAAEKINIEELKAKQLQIHVGITLDSIVLKLYKTTWSNENTDPLTAKTRIFFAIWVNEKTLKQNRIYYNIHALKLRELKGYHLKSSDFAQAFRHDFQKYKNNWKNVNTQFGPLTLLEGWESYDKENLENIIAKLAINFLTIEHLIDDTLTKFEHSKKH
ncbi:hypothetical protein [Flavobacterium sp. J27]|uniref:hypothetical protein n=1 Tax=Flavobacterium sp. J27 TaxID=2060419 RepID=UPI001030BD12|nr:hypothetical protein [Flavobacterium sp. J27]